jgi:ribonuclease HI
MSLPVQAIEPSYPAMSESENLRVSEAVKPLLVKGAIVPVSDEEGQFVSKIFTVPKPDGTSRLVINLKPLNEYIEAPHFKMEDYRTACNVIRTNCYLASIDLKDAYYLIPVAEKHRKYLRFRWKNQLYEYTCIPFGLNVAPRLYTKLMKPVISYLRSQGFLSVYFLDDTLLIGDTYLDCELNVQETLLLFKKLGFRVNFEKSILVPQTRVKFLGFIFDTISMRIMLPIEKRKRIELLAKNSLSCQEMKIECLARLIGTLVAAVPAVRYGQVYVRSLEYDKIRSLRAHNGCYQAKVSLCDESKADLQWWIVNIFNSYSEISNDKFDITIYTDASLTGWGATSQLNNAKGYWDCNERKQHINELELKAVFNGLRSLAICNQKVLLRVDNTTAVSYINRYGGCRSSNCQAIAKDIWTWCEQQNITILASYINTVDNYVADELSRDTHKDLDFRLSSGRFKEICSSFFVPSVDLFATSRSRQCKRYVSWYPDVECEAVDAFTIDWKDKFYAFPPFNLVGRTLRKIFHDRCHGIVVVPNWPTQAWYPLFKKMCISNILTFDKDTNSILCPYLNRPHPLSSQVGLMSAVLSGDRS